jgi:hypothetical protein
LPFWLNRHGFSITVVERYRGLRPGGQAIDVRGPALTVLDWAARFYPVINSFAVKDYPAAPTR